MAGALKYWDATSSSWKYVPRGPKGDKGDTGVSTGDMVKATYDPTSKNADAFARTNHSGTQTASTISDFSAAADARVAAATATGTGSLVRATSPALTTPTGIVKSDVGLGNVDNTSDATKNTATVTLTNKRITVRVASTASSAIPTPDVSAADEYLLTALAANASFLAPTGTPTDGQKLLIRIKDNGTARTLTWDSIYRALGTLLPTTTIASKTVYIGCIYNSADTKWDVLAVSQEG